MQRRVQPQATEERVLGGAAHVQPGDDVEDSYLRSHSDEPIEVDASGLGGAGGSRPYIPIARLLAGVGPQ